MAVLMRFSWAGAGSEALKTVRLTRPTPSMQFEGDAPSRSFVDEVIHAIGDPSGETASYVIHRTRLVAGKKTSHFYRAHDQTRSKSSTVT